MLSMRAPLKLHTLRPMMQQTEAFEESLFANYRVAAISVTPKDLLYLVTVPPEVYMSESGMSSLVISQSQTKNRSISLNLVNRLVSLLSFSQEYSLTYQDSVFVSNMLRRLKVTDISRFVNQLRQMREEHKSLREMLVLYEEGRPIFQAAALGEEEKSKHRIKRKGKKSIKGGEAEKEKKALPECYLHHEILKRLDTVHIYRQMAAVYHQYTGQSAAITYQEMKLAEQERQADTIRLSVLKEQSFGLQRVPFEYYVNPYELWQSKTVIEKEEAVLAQMVECVLYSLAERTSYIMGKRGDCKAGRQLHIENAIYQSGENTWRRLEETYREEYRNSERQQVYRQLQNQMNREEIRLLREMKDTSLQSLQAYIYNHSETAADSKETASAQEEGETVSDMRNREMMTRELSHTRQQEQQLKTLQSTVEQFITGSRAAYLHFLEQQIFSRDSRALEVRIEAGGFNRPKQSPELRPEIKPETPTSETRKFYTAGEQTDRLVEGSRLKLAEQLYELETLRRELESSAATTDRYWETVVEQQEPHLHDLTGGLIRQTESRLLQNWLFLEGDVTLQPTAYRYENSEPAEAQETYIDVDSSTAQKTEISILKQQLDEINIKNIQTKQIIEQYYETITKEPAPELPDRIKTRREALKVLEGKSGSLFGEEETDFGFIARKEKRGSHAEMILSQVDDMTRYILEQAMAVEREDNRLLQRTAPAAVMEQLLREVGQAETAIESLKKAPKSAKRILDENGSRIHQTEEKRQSRQHQTGLISHYTKESRSHVEFVHKQLDQGITEEFLETLSGGIKPARRMETVQQVIHNAAADIAQNQISTGVQSTREAKKLQAMIERGIKSQMGAISDQVYTKLEKRLQSEQMRRGR